MILAQKLVNEVEVLTDKQKNEKMIGNLMDEVIFENEEALKELAK